MIFVIVFALETSLAWRVSRIFSSSKPVRATTDSADSIPASCRRSALDASPRITTASDRSSLSSSHRRRIMCSITSAPPRLPPSRHLRQIIAGPARRRSAARPATWCVWKPIFFRKFLPWRIWAINTITSPACRTKEPVRNHHLAPPAPPRRSAHRSDVPSMAKLPDRFPGQHISLGKLDTHHVRLSSRKRRSPTAPSA